MAAAVLAAMVLLIDTQGGQANPSSQSAQAAPGGDIMLAVSQHSDPAALIGSLPFEVSSVSAFAFDDQSFRTYVPGAPSHVNRPLAEQLAPGTIVWLRLPPLQLSQATAWVDSAQRSQSLIAATQPNTLRTPRKGQLTVGVLGTTSLSAFIEAQDFEVAAVLIFDQVQQRFRSYVAGAPSHVNSISESSILRPYSIVWVRRSFRDAGSDAPAAGPPLANVGDAPVVPSVPGDSPAPQAPAPAPGGAQGGSPSASPTSTPAAKPSATPTAKPTSTPAPKPSATPTPAPTAAPKEQPVRSGAGLMRHTTYESGSSTREEAHTSASHALSTVTTARSGSRAGQALLKPGDPKWHGGGYRAEWHAMDHTSGRGAERWQGISFYFPKDYNQGSNSNTWDDRIIFQYTDEGSPMFSLHLDADRQQLWVRRKTSTGGSQTFQELARWSFDTEQWYDLVFHSKWTKDSSGVFEVWVNGEKKVSYNGRTLAIRDVTYSKWGIYGQPTKLYFDEIRIAEGANRRGDVTP